MPSSALSVGTSQLQQTARYQDLRQTPPGQVSRNNAPPPPTSKSPDRPAAHAGPSNPPQAPEFSRAPAQPRSSNGNPASAPSAPSLSTFQPVSASAPPKTQPRPPTMSQPSLTTPPSTSAGPHNPSHREAVQMVAEAANAQARQVLDPIRQSVSDALTSAHVTLAQHLAQLQSMLVRADLRQAQAQAQIAALRDQNARLTEERDRAREHAERVKKDAEAAVEEVSKMKENVMPRLVIDHYQLKGEHDAIKAELASAQAANRELREKLQVQVQATLAGHAQAGSAQAVTSMFVVPRARPDEAGDVKAEQGVESGVQVKEERLAFGVGGPVKGPSSPSAVDAETAFALAQAINLRKQKQREQDVQRFQAMLLQLASGPAQAQAQPTQATVSPSHMLPTPPLPLRPRLNAAELGQQIAPAPCPDATQAQAVPSAAPVPKVEEEDGAAMLCAIPELGHVDVSGVLEIIDLTHEGEVTDSPMQLTGDLPSFSRRTQEDEPASESEERKRLPETGWNERQVTPNKRRRTEDHMVVDSFATLEPAVQNGPLAEQAAGDGAPLTDMNNSFLRSLIAVAESMAAEPAVSLPPVEFESATLSTGNHGGERDAGRPKTPAHATNDRDIAPDTQHGTAPAPSSFAVDVASPPQHVAMSDLLLSASSAPAYPSATTSSTRSRQVPADTAPVSNLVNSLAPESTSVPSVPPPTAVYTEPPPAASVSTSAIVPQAPPITPVVDAFANCNLSFPSPTNAVQLHTDTPESSPSKPAPPKKLGIAHIELIYQRLGEDGQYKCRLCDERKKKYPNAPTTRLAAHAPGEALVAHVENAHPATIEYYLQMTPEDIREQKQEIKAIEQTSLERRPRRKS
ncbi:hypothetical protein DICSQDRAFT_171506 [Dichomitus squalens LYAD-421 SS1]|uniref:Uncharacterized protein n=1 Tax=Dichomitus squalens (strain LYAD-421) TaxID=732165 RepID=R7SUX0_DICSQ|nr:uncharacterized protein DICSQDRAFT_171506 [Dichomitus squalens LYAD-421 SS1]EJF60019.1 hypothetical protein DICSQDRAFT_171506 [Dichomitus squalens LYAD-421 SS1]